MSEIECVFTLDEGQVIGLLFQFRNKEDGLRVTREQAIEIMHQEFLDSLILPPHEYDYILTIETPGCGETVVYQKPEDIPRVDVPCTCGNPNHWFIKYDIVT